MNCPKCGSNMSWRDAKCPYCGAVNPAQKKERARKRRRRRRAKPVLYLLALAALVLLIMLILPKKDKNKAPVPPETTVPVVTTQPTEPVETEAPTTLPPETAETTPDGEVIIDPSAYSSPAEFASSAAVRTYMKQNQANGDGTPARYAVVDINGDGTQELLVVSGGVDGSFDTLLFTEGFHFSAAIASYGEVMLQPDEHALAYQPMRPQGTVEDGNYSGGHSFYKLHAASGALYPMYSIGLDEGVPLKDMGGVTQTITMEDWQEAVNSLLPVVWLSIA